MFVTRRIDMLKIVLSLIGDWLAYRRAVSGGPARQRSPAGLGAVSIWPVEREAPLATQ